MRGLNRVIIAGNLARDPELRYTVNKRAWLRFTVAVNTKWKNANGEYQEVTDFIPVVAWGPIGENISKYLRKGSAVLVEGKIKTRTYEANDGSGKKYATDVNADNILLLGPAQQRTQGSSFDPNMGSQDLPEAKYSYPDDGNFGKNIYDSGFIDGPQPGGSENSDMSDNEIPF